MRQQRCLIPDHILRAADTHVRDWTGARALHGTSVRRVCDAVDANPQPGGGAQRRNQARTERPRHHKFAARQFPAKCQAQRQGAPSGTSSVSGWTGAPCNTD
jgi:hypothetical protein